MTPQGIRTNDRTRCFKKIGYILPCNIQEIENACTRVYRPTGMLSGFHDLDRLTNGFEPCDFIVVAGGPGMGKTSICLDIARNVALNDHKSIGFFSFEMSTEQLITRMISRLQSGAFKIRLEAQGQGMETNRSCSKPALAQHQSILMTRTG